MKSDVYFTSHQSTIIFVQVRENKRTGQKLATIPSKFINIRPGDYVRVIKEAVD